MRSLLTLGCDVSGRRLFRVQRSNRFRTTGPEKDLLRRFGWLVLDLSNLFYLTLTHVVSAGMYGKGMLRRMSKIEKKLKSFSFEDKI